MKWLIGLMGGLAMAHGAAPTEAFKRETEAWRADRVARLTAPDSWLSLAGLHFLKPGENTIGSAKDNDVVIAKAPARLGKVTVGTDLKVVFALLPGVDARVDGQRVETAELKTSAAVAKPTLVTFGTVSFFALEPGSRRALRVKDSASERRTRFAGLDYFPLDPSWRIEARWEPYEKSRLVPFTDILGQTSPMLIPGKAVFEREGKRIELLAIDEGRNRPLFFVISDPTAGKETYGGGRHLYTEWPKDGKVVLDFNRAENPPCAFTPFSMCPVPPKENRLPFAVAVGEKTYRGKID